MSTGRLTVPFNDLYSQYRSIQSDIDRAISDVIRESAYIKGRFVSEFEKEFAEALGARFCVGCANGTDSLEMALKALGVGEGDEILVPANTWISTSEAVSAVGAKPVFVDIEPDYYTINTALIEEKITSKTKAIIPVHLYGHPADMGAVQRIAKNQGLKVIEDCAQSHLAEFKGQKTGTIGEIGSFSFFPGKNLGCYGDGGAIVTSSAEYAEFMAKLGNHGRLGKFDHEFEGRNSRLDGLQAAILSAKLPHLAEWTRKRQGIAKLYSELLQDSAVKVPKIKDEVTHVFHLYVVEVKGRDRVRELLSAEGIETGVHYPRALPFVKAYERLGHKPSDFPVAYAAMDKILSLPIYPEMSAEAVEYVSAKIKEASEAAL
ncbi:MAG: DegT/DnrJ/EryC1/StrS family aminotransferase [Deltaproteobacteria bacterium]|nr:DegT/DnrJ/EryC1/StrS family aminotransferase [Deltaproteobacteria bacterium]